MLFRCLPNRRQLDALSVFKMTTQCCARPGKASNGMGRRFVKAAYNPSALVVSMTDVGSTKSKRNRLPSIARAARLMWMVITCAVAQRVSPSVSGSSVSSKAICQKHVLYARMVFSLCSWMFMNSSAIASRIFCRYWGEPRLKAAHA